MFLISLQPRDELLPLVVVQLQQVGPQLAAGVAGALPVGGVRREVVAVRAHAREVRLARLWGGIGN